jgi:LPPG:FO 2-phospho-L-lactate transferase
MDLNFVALAGGVGGAKLADGLAQVLQPDHLTIIVNTGDDFLHMGLHISPDLDTVCYTLAGMENPATGWGRINETWYVLKELKKMGMPDWFQLGDADLATHLVRSIRLDEGRSLSQITDDFCKMWDIKVRVLPMSDNLVQTWVYTNEGDLEFQEYFVHRNCEPKVKGVHFEGAEKSLPAPGVLEAIDQSDAIIFCPSNPWVSIDPILAIPNIKDALKRHRVYAVSPIIGNKTVKGPAAKMFSELGIPPSALAVAQHYGNLIRYLVIDNSDLNMVDEINTTGIRTFVTDILMRDHTDRTRLAQEIVELISADVKGDNK